MAQCSVCKSETELFDSGVPVCPSCYNEKPRRGERMVRYEPESEIEERPPETRGSSPIWRARIEDRKEKTMIAKYGLLFVFIGALLALVFGISEIIRKIRNLPDAGGRLLERVRLFCELLPLD